MSLSAILVPGLFAALVAIAITVAIERFGGVLGGLLGTLPTTIIPASWGIFNASDAPGFESAMYAVPPGMLMSAFFLWMWRVLPPRFRRGSLLWRLTLVTSISLGTWLLAALLWVMALRQLDASVTQQGIVALAALTALLGVGLWATARAPKTKQATRPVLRRVLLLRGVGAGCAIAFAVALAQSGNALAAGAAAVFPAIFLTTMVSLWLSQGEAVPAAATGPMMLGSSAVATYALLATRTFPAWGAPLGAASAWSAAALLVTAPALWFFWHRASVRAPRHNPAA